MGTVALPRTLPMHPVDVVFGTTIPQIQAYLTCVPAGTLDEAALRAGLQHVLQTVVPRLAYRLPRRLGTIRTLRLADDLAAPLQLLPAGGLRALAMDDLRRAMTDRHWALLVEPGPRITTLLFLMDHFLCHGYAGRRLLFAAADLLAEQGAAAAPLAPPAEQDFVALQEHLTARFRDHEGGWAEHRQVEFEAVRVRALSRALGMPFTEATVLWLARTIQDVTPRPRPMEILSFRMERDRPEDERLDPAFGNAALTVQLWEMLPDGFYSPLDPSGGLGSEQLQQFVEFYRRFPAKGLLTRLLRAQVRKGQAEHKGVDRERLVVNNLGATDRPFYRVMFFDPFNDADRLGLVFADGRGARLTLQFSPPRRYLAWFPWDAFEERLGDNLEAMVDRPRIETR